MSKVRDHFPTVLATAQRLWRDKEDTSNAAGEAESEVSDDIEADAERFTFWLDHIAYLVLDGDNVFTEVWLKQYDMLA